MGKKQKEYEIDTTDENSFFEGMDKKEAKKAAKRLSYAL
jgi:hypothetical protein|tara:strand:- start:46 stop:162 length:117 start_codon:yes stop_codon:yes gene_type:complete